MIRGKIRPPRLPDNGKIFVGHGNAKFNELEAVPLSSLINHDTKNPPKPLPRVSFRDMLMSMFR